MRKHREIIESMRGHVKKYDFFQGHIKMRHNGREIYKTRVYRDYDSAYKDAQKWAKENNPGGYTLTVSRWVDD